MSVVLVRMLRCSIVGLLSFGCTPEESAPIVLVRMPSAEVRGRDDLERIQVLPVKRPSRPAEVVGVVDAHVGMGDHDHAMNVLREKAAALGADAVIGVDFQHGEGHADEPIHLSGLAIRYLDRGLSTD